MMGAIVGAVAEMLGFAGKRSTAYEDKAEQDYLRRTKLMKDGYWSVWVDPQQGGQLRAKEFIPYSYDRVELTRDFEEVWISDPWKLDPQMNVNGLYWRPMNKIIDVTPEILLIEESNHE